MLTPSESQAVHAGVEAARDAAWNAREPLLQRFRATADERKQRALEGQISSVVLSDVMESGRIQEFGEALAKLGQEDRRFERWLETLPAQETEEYRSKRY